jgi:hypothetical protein
MLEFVNIRGCLERATYYRLLSKTRNHELTVQPDAELPRYQAQLSQRVANPTQIEHRETKHALVTFLTLQIRLVVILAPDGDVPQLKGPQATEQVKLKRHIRERFRVEYDCFWDDGEVC